MIFDLIHSFISEENTRQPLNTPLLSFLLYQLYKKEKVWFEYLVLMILLLQKSLEKTPFLQNFCLGILEISYSGKKENLRNNHYIWGTITTFVAALSKRKQKSHHLQGSKPLVILLPEWTVESSIKAAADPENSIQLNNGIQKKTAKSNTICKYQYPAAFVSLQQRFFKTLFLTNFASKKATGRF